MRPVFILALLALAAAAPALAQTGAWPTTSWLLVRDAGLSQEPVQEQDWLGTGANAVRDELDASSAWLARLGFRAPRLPQARTGQYPAFVVPARETGAGTIGVYVQPRDGEGTLADRKIKLNRDMMMSPAFYRDGSIQGTGQQLENNYETLMTSVHELFHAVQASYPRTLGAPLHWIGEGTAEAVMLAWLRRRGLPHTVELGSYDTRSLYEGSYNMGHFWLAVGQDARARDGVAYLHRFYQTPMGPASGRMPGVAWLDGNLRTARLGGLQRYLTYFAATHLQGPEHFGAEAAVPIGASGAETRTVSGQKPLTIAAFRATFARPPELARLEVTIEDMPDSAHLVIGDEAFEGNQASVETTDEVCGTGATCEIPVRVVNAADDVTATRAISYTIGFDLVGGCDFRYPTGVYGVAYRISAPGQPDKYFAIKFPGAGARGRQPVSGPFEAAFLDTAASGFGRTLMTGEISCAGGAIDIGGLATSMARTPAASERRVAADATGRWALPARPRVGQTLPDVETTLDIAVEGDRAFSATTRTFGQTIAGRERAPLTSPDASLRPFVRRGLSTWKVTGQTQGRGGLHEDAILGEMERRMEEMGVELDASTRAMIEGMMGGLLGGAAEASAAEPPQPFALWYSLDFGLVKMESAGVTTELFRVYRE